MQTPQGATHQDIRSLVFYKKTDSRMAQLWCQTRPEPTWRTSIRFNHELDTERFRPLETDHDTN